MSTKGYNQFSIRSTRSNRRKRKTFPRLLIFAVLAGAAYFFFFKDQKKEQARRAENKPAGHELSESQSATAAELKNSGDDAKSAGNSSAGKVSRPEKAENKSAVSRELHQKLIKLYSEAKNCLNSGEYEKVLVLTRKIMDAVPETSRAWSQAANLLGEANAKILFSDYRSKNKVIYTVVPGDSLDKIVKKFCTTLEALQSANNLPKTSSTIRVGQNLVVYKGFWKIIIKKSLFRLYLYNSGELFKVYRIATGKGNKTPEGAFVIASKIKNPEWTFNGVKYPYGSPQNVLGTRWMRLRPAAVNPNKNLSGYGIHGTWQPESIGKMASNGCIRMKNSDVEELFAIIPKYTNPDGNLVPVIIEK